MDEISLAEMIQKKNYSIRQRRRLPRIFLCTLLTCQQSVVSSFAVTSRCVSSSTVSSLAFVPSQRPARTGGFTSSRLAASTTPVAEEENANPSKKHGYNWTRQTLAIALPALIGMLVGESLTTARSFTRYFVCLFSLCISLFSYQTPSSV